MQPALALRVVDGDDIEFAGKRYRLAGFDAPQLHVFRSAIDRDLEYAGTRPRFD